MVVNLDSPRNVAYDKCGESYCVQTFMTFDGEGFVTTVWAVDGGEVLELKPNPCRNGALIEHKALLDEYKGVAVVMDLIPPGYWGR